MLPSSRVLCVIVVLLLASAVRAQSDYTFARVDAPAAIYTQATGFNNAGTIVGTYGGDGTPHAFVARDGEFEDLVLPVAGATAVSPVAINDHDDIIGTYLDSTGLQHGYLLRGNGQFTNLDAPNVGAVETRPIALNNQREIVGVYTDSDFAAHPFYYRRGRFQDLQLSIPGAVRYAPSGISGRGTIVGTFSTSDGLLHSFVASNGRGRAFDEPGATGAIVRGISEGGLIVGSATTSGQDTPMPIQHAFLYAGGTFTDLVPAFPNEPPRPIIYSQGVDVNDDGVVLGQSTPTRGAITISFTARPSDD